VVQPKCSSTTAARPPAAVQCASQKGRLQLADCDKDSTHRKHHQLRYPIAQIHGIATSVGFKIHLQGRSRPMCWQLQLAMANSTTRVTWLRLCCRSHAGSAHERMGAAGWGGSLDHQPAQQQGRAKLHSSTDACTVPSAAVQMQLTCCTAVSSRAPCSTNSLWRMQ